jgi:hypothetical protein
MSGVFYVATSGEKLYYTDNSTGTVTCCDLHGITQWEFTDAMPKVFVSMEIVVMTF